MGNDKSYKNFFDDGVTTYHADGSKSVTYKNLLDNGTTTYHSDGSKSKTYKNVLDSGYTTYHEDGSRSRTYKNILDSGITTYHEDGSKSRTYKNILDNGYTTYHPGMPRGMPYYGYSAPVRTQTPRPVYAISKPTPEEKRLGDKQSILAVLAVVSYILLTAYVIVTFFNKTLPTSYFMMLGMLSGAMFLLEFLSMSGNVLEFGWSIFLLIIQSLIYIFQVVFRLNWNSNPFVGKGDLFVMLFGPAVFLAAIIIGALLGWVYEKHLRDKTIHPQPKKARSSATLADTLKKHTDKMPKSGYRSKTLEEMLEENRQASAQVSSSPKTTRKK